MNKIFLVIQREYLTRVKKKSFIIMTLLAPFLMAALFVVPIWLAMGEKTVHKIAVIDDSGITGDGDLKNTTYMKYEFPPLKLQQAKDQLHDAPYDMILWIPANFIGGTNGVALFYKKEPGIVVLEKIKQNLEAMRGNILLSQAGINLDTLSKITALPAIQVNTTKIEEGGKETDTSTEISFAIGFMSGFLIYIFIFLYGVQVMRGVIEEKVNRIVEVIISSVKPFQLMMGKIVGVALVGLTQFILWIIMTFVLITVAQATIFSNIKLNDNPIVKDNPSMTLKPGMNVTNFDMGAETKQQQQLENVNVTRIFSDLMSRNFVLLISVFIFYFLGGYLLYSALFAAVGAAVDNETETQQFMLPITLPMVFAFIMAQAIIQNPEGPMAFWLSIIPFTSPVIMMVRLPFGVPAWELGLSMVLLVAGFIFTTWLAGRIYRTGILMYGKKVSWKELGKWLFYKG